MNAIPVTRDMLSEFYASDAYARFQRNAEKDESEFVADEDNVARAIQEAAEDRWAAGDAIENLMAGPYGEEQAATLLHGDPVAAQALLRKHFIRAFAEKIIAQLGLNFAADQQRRDDERAEYEADCRAESQESRLQRSAA
jgi:hypothetical protein